MQVVGSFGESGHMAGQFRNVHSVTVDSKGNVYTGEVEGRRVQKFTDSLAVAAQNEDFPSRAR
jgi:hypothetical protein